MALVNVEILIMGRSTKSKEAVQSGDVITIQPAGFEWGNGDLTGNMVFCTMLDLPCPFKGLWKRDFRCSQCKYQGIKWDSPNPIVGDVALINDVCPIVKHEGPDTKFRLALDSKGFPIIENYNWVHKKAYKIDFSSILSNKTIDEVQKEDPRIALISDALKVIRLANARNNPITENMVLKK